MGCSGAIEVEPGERQGSGVNNARCLGPARVGTHSNVDWPVVLAFAAASMVGGLLGGPLTKRASASTLTTAFGILLVGVCAVTAYDLLAA